VSGVRTFHSIRPRWGDVEDSEGIRSHDAKRGIPRYLFKPGVAGSESDSSRGSNQGIVPWASWKASVD
jgi:hypothetical protein